jgi:hypothetical protein
MVSRLLRAALLLAIIAGAPTLHAQQAPGSREQGVIRALLFVRGAASEELRVIPASSITVDASRIADRSGHMTDSDVIALGEQLRARVVRALDSRCERAGAGETTTRALIARAECAIATSRYYVEPGELQVSGNNAFIMIHVFRAPQPSSAPAASRIDYAGYKIELTLGSDGWGSPRLISIFET